MPGHGVPAVWAHLPERLVIGLHDVVADVPSVGRNGGLVPVVGPSHLHACGDRPKVEAAVSFVRATGGEALITSPAAFGERGGTRVTR